MDINKTGQLIRETRTARGLTQKELAAQLHISDRTVSKWERGIGFPDVALLEPLAAALDLPVHCLLSGEAAPLEPSPQLDQLVRDALRVFYEQGRRKLRRNISSILAGLVLLALSGYVIFGMLDYMGAFRRDVLLEVPVSIYENRAAVGETTVHIDGELNVVGKRSFWGKFHIAGVELTGRDQVSGYIRWDHPEKGFQEIVYTAPGQTWVEGNPVERYLYISPDMTQFALSLESGQIIATDPYLAALQGVDGVHFPLDHDAGFAFVGHP